MVTIPWTAQGHNPTSAFGLSAATPQSTVEFETRWAQYPDGLDGHGGSWLSSALRVEYAVNQRVSFAAYLPMARVSPKGADEMSGLGDSELSVKWSVIRSPRGFGHLSIGTGLELPTGDTDDNIGSGHYEFSPFITYQTPGRGHAVGFARINYLAAFGGDDHDHGMGPHAMSVVAPHAEQELRTLVGGAWVERSVYFSTSIDHALPLDGPGPDGGFFTASVEVGVTALADWLIALTWEHPISSDRRIDGGVRLGVAYFFDQADPQSQVRPRSMGEPRANSQTVPMDDSIDKDLI